MNEQMQKDLDIMRDVYMTRSQQEAFDRIKASLSPDREAVAIAICETFTEPKGLMWAMTGEDGREYWLACADAAIKAMQGARP